MRFSIYLGDISDAPAEAVCTSTNPRLTLMMGTGASIRARGGPPIVRACESHPPLAAGAVYPTPAGALPHQLVIHCVASDASHRSSANIVRACVTNALACADAAGCTTVAMPILGTGHARLRFADAARAMAETALSVPTRVREVKFVTSDAERVDELQSVLQSAAASPVAVERSPELDAETETLWPEEYSLHFDPT